MPTGLSDAQRIVVFRGLQLGDALCAVPAWRALRAACPRAQITWVGLPWAAELADRLPMIDDFIAFPGAPVPAEPLQDALSWPAFLATVRARRFDWALQLHGNGVASNPVVAQFGAAQMACFVPRRRARFPAEVLVPWPRNVDEVDRLLTLTDALGCPRQGRHLEFPVGTGDRAALQALWPATAPPLAEVNAAVVHVDAAASPQRMAQVADRFAAGGHTVVLTGAATPVAGVAQAMSHAPIDLTGRTSLWTLAALVERARCVASNDPGVSALATALNVQALRIDDGALVPDPGQHLATQAVWRELSTRLA